VNSVATHTTDTPETHASTTPKQEIEYRSQTLEIVLRSFRRRELRERTVPSRRQLASDLSIRFSVFLAGYIGTITIGYPQNLLAIILFAIASVSVLGSWFHDTVHGNLRTLKSLSSTAMRIGAAPVGFSVSWWRYKHVKLHHRYVGDPEFDPDIQFGSLLRVSRSQKWHRLHSIQQYYIWLLLPFSTLNMLKPNELRQRRKFERKCPTFHCPPSSLILFNKYGPFFAVWAPAAIFQSASSALCSFLTYQLVTGTLVSLITQVQHNTDISDDSADFSRRWPLCDQLMRTSDVANLHRGIWWWVCGGTNYHVVHHLIPSLSFLELPEVTKRLQVELQKAGFSLNNHSNMLTAARSHGRLLRVLSSRDCQKVEIQRETKPSDER
jgi:linoleoyl-CoA desaturase